MRQAAAAAGTLLAAASFLAGCSRSDEPQTRTVTVTRTVAAEPPPPPPGTTTTATPPPAAAPTTKPCRNPRSSYAVRFPMRWHTNRANAQIEPCSYFNPTPFTIEQNTDEIPSVIGLRVERGELEGTVQGHTDPTFNRVLRERRSTVRGRALVTVESEATGEGLFPEGYRMTVALLDLGGSRVLVGTAYAIPGSRYAESRRVLDGIVRSYRPA